MKDPVVAPKPFRLMLVIAFVVLVGALLGSQVRAPFQGRLAAMLIVAIGAAGWRAYRSATPYVWW